MHDFHGTFRDLLHAANLRHGTDGFTSPPKEGVLRIYSPLKIRRLRPGLNPRTWVLNASTLLLDHLHLHVKIESYPLIQKSTSSKAIVIRHELIMPQTAIKLVHERQQLMRQLLSLLPVAIQIMQRQSSRIISFTSDRIYPNP